MKTALLGISMALVFMSSAGVANAKGCLKGAAVGGVAGHVAGHHGLLGAAAGCAIGRHRANKADKEKIAPETVDTKKGHQP